MDKTANTSVHSPVAIMCAPNGGRLQKSDHPKIPITPTELAETAENCLLAGASAFHFHVRDEQGAHSLDARRYRDATDAIRARVGNTMHLQVTTEAQGRFSPEDQISLVESLVPEGVSLALREILPMGRDNSPWQSRIRDFFSWMDQSAVTYQLILYSPDELERLAQLRDVGIVPSTPLSLLFVLGAYNPPTQATPADLVPFLANKDPLDSWWIAAFGPHEGRCALTAAFLGGHIRIGFENNFNLLSGVRAPDNASLVQDIASALANAGIEVAKSV